MVAGQLNSIIKLLNSINTNIKRLARDIEDDTDIFDCVFGELGQEQGKDKYFIRIEKDTELYNYIFNYFVKLSGSTDKQYFKEHVYKIRGSRVLLHSDSNKYDTYTINDIEFNTTNLIIRPYEPAIKYYPIGTEVKLVKWPALD